MKLCSRLLTLFVEICAKNVKFGYLKLSLGKLRVIPQHTKMYAVVIHRRCISYRKSVRPSVRLTLVGIVLKLGNTEGSGLHHRIAQCLEFLMPRMIDGG